MKVTLTFDNGPWPGVTEQVLDTLAGRGLRATFFVVAGRLDVDGFLSSDDVRELLDAGMKIGSHGLDHRPWRALGTEELADQLARARSALEEVVEHPVTEVSCPFGDYGRGVLRTLRGLGYERVYTSDGGLARETSWLQPRNTVRPGPGVLERGEGGEPARIRLLRRAKGVAKRWR